MIHLPKRYKACGKMRLTHVCLFIFVFVKKKKANETKTIEGDTSQPIKYITRSLRRDLHGLV